MTTRPFSKWRRGPAANEGFGDVFHLDRGHDAGLDAGLFERVLESEGVDDGGEHAHVVGRIAVHPAFTGGRGTTPDVAAADDDRQLQGGRDDFLDLLGQMTGDAGREVVTRFAESFTGKF